MRESRFVYHSRLSMLDSLLTKIPSPVQGRRVSPRYHPACPETGPLGLTLTGETRRRLGLKPGFTGEACSKGRSQTWSGQASSTWALRGAGWARTSLSQLAGGWSTTPANTFGGPREIRTLDLLNAIETRSQLRYGPRFMINLWTWRDSNPRPLQCD
jgi:hypothetical protein